MSDEKPVRHLLGLSGGKDSAALAIYMRDKVPDMEYLFADTGAELPETLALIAAIAKQPEFNGTGAKRHGQIFYLFGIVNLV